MTTPIIGTNYSPPAALNLPLAFNSLDPSTVFTDLTGLAGCYMFGGEAGHTLRNFANPDLPLTQIGTPTVTGAGGVSGSWQHGYETGINETEAMTIMAVFKPFAYTNGSSILNNGKYERNGVGPTTPVGLHMSWQNAVNGALIFDPQSGKSIAFNPATAGGSSNSSDYGIACCRVDATNADVSWTRNGTRVDSSTLATGSRPIQPSRTLRIMANFGTGSASANGGADTIPNLLMLAIWTGNKLSDTNRNDTITALRTWFNTTSGLGITTL